ncbi:MAG: hypothetical protein U0353_25670 [Sandaracinus sp.]
MPALDDPVLVGLAGLDPRAFDPEVIEHRAEARGEGAPAALLELVRGRREVVHADSLGTPPSSKSAPCKPRTSASKVSLNASCTKCQPLNGSTMWKNMCANTAPAIVTPSSFALVKSIEPIRPAVWVCGKKTSL